MSDPRVPWLSAFRGAAAPARPVQPPSVPSPVGAYTNATLAGMRGRSAGPASVAGIDQSEGEGGPPAGNTAGGQAVALRANQQAWDDLGMMGKQGTTLQEQMRQGYQAGGFQGMTQAVPNWFDIPEYVRTQLLSGARGGA